ncbi:MAG: hypothetical protein HY596_03820 [Candidatus Omnitrophica bacterium]|nr:hypothetical protein [Candidatus Omnitrophota bacterium]
MRRALKALRIAAYGVIVAIVVLPIKRSWILCGIGLVSAILVVNWCDARLKTLRAGEQER